MRKSGIGWRASRCTVDEFDDPQPNPKKKEGQWAAIWKLEGNIDYRSETQVDL